MKTIDVMIKSNFNNRFCLIFLGIELHNSKYINNNILFEIPCKDNHMQLYVSLSLLFMKRFLELELHLF